MSKSSIPRPKSPICLRRKGKKVSEKGSPSQASVLVASLGSRLRIETMREEDRYRRAVESFGSCMFFKHVLLVTWVDLVSLVENSLRSRGLRAVGRLWVGRLG